MYSTVSQVGEDCDTGNSHVRTIWSCLICGSICYSVDHNFYFNSNIVSFVTILSRWYNLLWFHFALDTGGVYFVPAFSGLQVAKCDLWFRYDHLMVT